MSERGTVSEIASAAPAAAPPRPAEPPREIWFHRRVNPVTALRELWQFRELMLTLAERDVRVRYKQALLGVAWAVVTPVLLMIVFTLVFHKFTKVQTGGAPYALFSYLGLLPWTFFSGAVSQGGLNLVQNQPVMNKVYCPREVFPIAGMIVAAVDTVIAIGVLLVLFPATGFTPHVQAFWVPLLVLVLLAFTTAWTMLVAIIVVYARDIRLVLPMALQVGLFVTPVAYSFATVSKSRELLLLYSALNPLGPVIDGLRRTVLLGLAPDWQTLGIGAASSFLLLVVSYLLFKRLETGVADIA